MPGRKKSEIKRFYNVVIKKSKNKEVREFHCKFCRKEYSSGNVRNLAVHIVSCQKSSEISKSVAKKVLQGSSDRSKYSTSKSMEPTQSAATVRPTSSLSQTSQSTHSSAPSPSSTPSGSRANSSLGSPDMMFGHEARQKKSDGKIETLFMEVSERQTQFKKDFARTVFATGYPLSMVESQEWKNLFRKYLPTLQLPTRHEISGPLLDQEYNETKSKVESKVSNAEAVALQMDGWENLRHESRLHVVATTPDPVLLRIIDTGVDRHTGDNMSEELKKVIFDIGPEKVLGGVTDNAAAMIKARNITKEEFPAMEWFACCDHSLNNLLKDLAKIQFIQSVVNDCHELCKQIIKSQLLAAWFSLVQKSKSCTITLKLPGETRFASHFFVIQSVKENKQIFKQLAIEIHPTKPELHLTASYKQLVLQENFWERVDEIYDLFSITHKWITMLESDVPRCDYVVEAFKEIETKIEHLCNEMPISADDGQKMLAALQKRRNTTVTNIHVASNLLNPNFKGEKLSRDQHVAAFQFIETFARNDSQFSDSDVSDIVVELGYYTAGVDFFANPYVINTANKMIPLHWWQGICSCTTLSKVARKILQMHPTSSATERSFSTAGHIHCKRRNRLTAARAEKLIYVKHNLNLLEGRKRTNQIQLDGTQDKKEEDEEVVIVEEYEEDSDMDEPEYDDKQSPESPDILEVDSDGEASIMSLNSSHDESSTATIITPHSSEPQSTLQNIPNALPIEPEMINYHIVDPFEFNMDPESIIQQLEESS